MLNPHTRTDEDLVTAIQAGGKAENKAMRYLYKDSNCRQIVRNNLKQFRADFISEDELLLEGLSAVRQNIIQNKFGYKGKLENYFGRIIRNKLIDRIRRQRPTFPIKSELIQGFSSSAENRWLQEEEEKMILDVLGQFPGDCVRLFQLRAEGLSLKEVAEELAYSGAELVKKKIKRCRNRLGEWLAENPAMDQYLKERWPVARRKHGPK